MIGFLAGAVIGFASGDDPGGFFAVTAEQKAAILGVVLAVPTGIVGAVIGATGPGEQWQSIPLPSAAAPPMATTRAPGE